jgi:hypothetical protein
MDGRVNTRDHELYLVSGGLEGGGVEWSVDVNSPTVGG